MSAFFFLERLLHRNRKSLVYINKSKRLLISVRFIIQYYFFVYNYVIQKGSLLQRIMGLSIPHLDEDVDDERGLPQNMQNGKAKVRFFVVGELFINFMWYTTSVLMHVHDIFLTSSQLYLSYVGIHFHSSQFQDFGLMKNSSKMLQILPLFFGIRKPVKLLVYLFFILCSPSKIMANFDMFLWNFSS